MQGDFLCFETGIILSEWYSKNKQKQKQLGNILFRFETQSKQLKGMWQY